MRLNLFPQPTGHDVEALVADGRGTPLAPPALILLGRTRLGLAALDPVFRAATGG